LLTNWIDATRNAKKRLKSISKPYPRIKKMKENLENDLMTDAEIMTAHELLTNDLETRAIAAIICAGCKHWNEKKPCRIHIGAKSGPSDFSTTVIWEGECHKNPPVKNDRRNDWDPKSEFPITAYDCHCSQFEA
jgi:hypothetical protein